MESMESRLEEKRKEIHDAINQHGIISEAAIKKSREFEDDFLARLMKTEENHH